MCLIKRHKGKFNFSNKTIDKSIPATRCCWYPLSRIEKKNCLRCCKWFKDKSVTRYNIMIFHNFFLYVTFFFLAQLYQRHDLLPRVIQYNTIQYVNIFKKYKISHLSLSSRVIHVLSVLGKGVEYELFAFVVAFVH